MKNLLLAFVILAFISCSGNENKSSEALRDYEKQIEQSRKEVDHLEQKLAHENELGAINVKINKRKR